MFQVGTRKRKIKDVISPRGIVRKVRSIRRTLQIARTENERKLKALKNKHKGERCFIIGNGPSLRISDLDLLNDEITFAFNKIYLAYDQTDFRPTYYMVADVNVIKNNAGRINGLCDESIKLFPYEYDHVIQPTERTIYFNFDYEYLYYTKMPKFSKNPLRCMYCGGTVTTKALQLAYYMGIREVYLIGIDFSFKVPDNRLQNGIVSSEGEINHFHPDYRKEGEVWGLPDLALQERYYRLAKKIYESDGRRIFNATRGGKLEVFPRIDFDLLFPGDSGMSNPGSYGCDLSMAKGSSV